MSQLLNKLLSLKSSFASGNEQRPNYFLGWRLVSYVVVGILVSGTIVSIWFIYSDVYRTLEDAHSVIVLSSSADADTINFTGYEKAINAIKEKDTIVTIPTNLRNPFSQKPATTTTSTL